MQKIINAPKRIDTNSALSFEAEVKKTLTDDTTHLLFEMRDTVYVSSAGLRVFLAAQKKINAIRGQMALQHVAPQVMEVFEVTGFSGILSLYSGAEADG